jgi:hypothetical protein
MRVQVLQCRINASLTQDHMELPSAQPLSSDEWPERELPSIPVRLAQERSMTVHASQGLEVRGQEIYSIIHLPSLRSDFT